MTSFAHRANRNSTHDSICRGCYATVATTTEEAELAEHEHAHICDRAYLFQATEDPSVRFTQSHRRVRQKKEIQM
jgi:hypothetical protein